MKAMQSIVTVVIIQMIFSLALLCIAGQKEQTFTAPAGQTGYGERMLQLGEELEYNVYYSFFNIGTLRFKITDKEDRNGRTIYHAYVFMDSNPSLSWLKELHVKYFSEIDQDVFSHGWFCVDSTSKKVGYRKMKFDYEKHIMFYEWGEKSPIGELNKIGETSIPIKGNCQDGLTIYYYAREHALESKKYKMPTFIDTSEVMTNINFGVETLNEEIDAVDYPVDVIKLDGKMDFVGVFGLTGEFEGVFSNDYASIPITARLKVILGSVRVELKKWKRGNWMPPQSAE